MIYNQTLQHEEGEYHVDADRSLGRMILDAFWDGMTVWWTESSLKLWIRSWLMFLIVGCMCPLAFLPHAFAITNVVGMVIILYLNGRELVRVRGVNKNMGWPHILGWAPVMVVNVLCLTTDWIGSDGELSLENAGDDNYAKARFVAVIYNTVTLGISILFDAADTYMYHFQGETKIERSKWTLSQLSQSKMGKPQRRQRPSRP